MTRRPIVHRANSNVRPLCGAPSGAVSTSGVILTCPECVRLSAPPDREEQLASLLAAAENYRAKGIA